MGTISKGILGGFSGKVGTVVGANWRGMDIIRSLPKKSSRIPTEEQLSQRLKFALVASFLAPLQPILSAFFGQAQNERSRRNLATSYHLKEAITGTFPNFTMDFTKVIVTKGDLLGPQNLVATPAAGAQVAFAWEDNSGQGNSVTTDGLLIVVYNPERSLYETRQMAATRTALSYNLDLPDSWATETVHVWVSMTSADGKKAANSFYVGAVGLV